jgi:hypothetical protein
MTPLGTRRARPRGLFRFAALAIAVVALISATQLAGVPVAAAERPARIFLGEPATLDPAAAGDAGSAAVIAQLFEGLTAIDPSLTPDRRWPRAESRRRPNGGLHPARRRPSRRVGLTAADVRRSWLR